MPGHRAFKVQEREFKLNNSGYHGECRYNRKLLLEATTVPVTRTSLSNRTLQAIIRVGNVVKKGEVYRFRLLGRNGFHVKAKNARFSAAGFRRCQNLKHENFSRKSTAQ